MGYWKPSNCLESNYTHKWNNAVGQFKKSFEERKRSLNISAYYSHTRLQIQRRTTKEPQSAHPAAPPSIIRSWHMANTRHKRFPNLNVIQFSKSRSDTCKQYAVKTFDDRKGFCTWKKSNEIGNAVQEPTMLLPPPSHGS